MGDPDDERYRVVLVNYRSLDAIRRLFESGILRTSETIVVDNGDNPAGVTELCKTFNAEPLLLDNNVGFATAVNRAVSQGGPTHLPWLLLNPDVSVTRTQLGELRSSLVSSGADAVAPALRLPDGRLQVGAGGGPLTLRSVMTYFLFVSHILPWCRGVFFTRSQSVKIERADWLCMACLMLAPNAFARFGPIPEDELVYAEDIAWGTLASAHGARLRLVPTVVVGHESGGSGGNAVWDKAFERLLWRRLGRTRGALAVASVRVGLAVRNAVRTATKSR